MRQKIRNTNVFQYESIVSYISCRLTCLSMALIKMPKKEPRPSAVTVRLSKKAVEHLKTLAKEHNRSQADVVEFLIQQEFKSYESKKK